MLPSAESLEGKPVPEVTFRMRVDGQAREISSADIFKDKTVVAFSLPGAYTPTCSSAHLPRYNELAETFRANGVDDVVCFSVNDPFVMSEWQRDLGADKITMVPDGNGEFARAMGMLVDKSDLGLGMRSWRYSMLIRNGVIEKAFIEPEKEGDPYEVSDADTMLSYVNPRAEVPEPVVIFAKPGCPHCARAKSLLQARGYRFDEIGPGPNVTSSTLRALSGSGTWPQVFIGGRLIGNADELEAYFKGEDAVATFPTVG